MRGESIALRPGNLQGVVTGAAAAAGAPSVPPEDARELSSAIAPQLRLQTLAELVCQPPEGIAPLDQFREALLLCHEAEGNPPSPFHLERTNAELLLYYRHELAGGFYEQRIRDMVNRDGWVEADATVVQLGISVVAAGIWLAVRERRREAAPICYRVHGPTVRAGERIAKPAPKLYMGRRAGCPSSACRPPRRLVVQAAMGAGSTPSHSAPRWD